MRERIEPADQYAWIVYAIAMVMFGGLAGYIIAMQNSQHATATAAAPISAAAAPA